VLIRHVRIENYRGIRTLDWSPPAGVVALIGPGDSGKSTILDAIELALSKQWNPQLSDNDFFGADVANPILIEVTVGALPSTLITDRKFGLDLTGWTSAGKKVDEPTDDCEAILTIQFTLSGEGDPQWAVVTERQADRRPIGAGGRRTSRPPLHLGQRKFTARPFSRLRPWGATSASFEQRNPENEGFDFGP
jgi:putative ATP-dependent endonuclease of the OLD family